MKKSIFLVSILLFLNCSKEKLSEQSVVDANIVVKSHTSLDDYIEKEFVLPYNISVEYRWEKNTAGTSNFTYPALPNKVEQVLKTIKELWLEVYSQGNLGGKDFFKGKNPLKIYLYGGENLDANGVERINNPSADGIEMYLYNVNDFDPKNYDKVFVLMRSVHHQFAKRLLELYPYNRDEFSKISQKKYISSSQEIKDLDLNQLRLFSLSEFANRNGFFTHHSRFSPEEDFAEIISVTLTHSQVQINQALTNAKSVPFVDEDPQVNERLNKEAQQAYAQLFQKKEFVYNYFKKEIGISLERMQTLSIQKMRVFVNN